MLSWFLSFLLLEIYSFRAHSHACAFVLIHPSHRRQRRRSIKTIHKAIPPGRVEDMDDWVRLSSESLYKFTGQSLLDVMDDVSSFDEIHSNERFAVLSHGNQTDPIYNYFNKAALNQFEWPESEIYSLPSRYSAPDGALRSDREQMLKTVEQQEEVRIIPTAIRQTKSGTQFQLTNVTLWNVFDDSGVRVGQTAWFD